MEGDEDREGAAPPDLAKPPGWPHLGSAGGSWGPGLRALAPSPQAL